MTELEAAQIRAADATTGTALIQNGVISSEEERARVANDTDSPYVDLDPLTMPEAAQPQPGEEGYQGPADAWTKTFGGIADTGGLLPPPAPDGASSNQAWGEVMSGISGSGGVGYDPGRQAASPEAWEGAAAGLAASGGVHGQQPKQALLAPPLRKVFGKDAPGRPTDEQFAAAFGMDANAISEPRDEGGRWVATASLRPAQPVSENRKSTVDDYRAAIRAGKPLQSLKTVLNKENGRFIVVDGNHRAAAYAAEHQPTAYVKVLESVANAREFRKKYLAGHYFKALGLGPDGRPLHAHDAFNPEEPRRSGGEQGAGEWTKGGAGGAPSKAKKARAPKGAKSSAGQAPEMRAAVEAKLADLKKLNRERIHQFGEAPSSLGPEELAALSEKASGSVDPFRRNTHAWSQREALANQISDGELEVKPSKWDHEPEPEELDALMGKATEIATRETQLILKGQYPSDAPADAKEVAAKLLAARQDHEKLFYEARVRHFEKDAEQIRRSFGTLP